MTDNSIAPPQGPIFYGDHFFSGGPTDFVMLAVLALLTALAFSLKIQRARCDLTIYEPKLAWLRAGVYFCLCWVISWGSGVLNTLAASAQPLPQLMVEPIFLICVAAILMFEYIAYYRVWAAGTYHNGRTLYPGWAIGFGILWGVAEAQLFLSFFAIAEALGANIWVAAAAMWVGVGIWYGPWHRFYWDFYVAPEHNVLEWNGKKVALVHVPNITITIAYLVYFREPHLFVGFMAFALVGAAWYMRFPAPSDQVSRIKIVDTYAPRPEAGN